MPRFSQPSATSPGGGKTGTKNRRARHLPFASLFQPASTSSSTGTSSTRKSWRKGRAARATKCGNTPPYASELPKSVEASSSRRQGLENISMDELIGMLALSRKMLQDIKKKQSERSLLTEEGCRFLENQTSPRRSLTQEVLVDHNQHCQHSGATYSETPVVDDTMTCSSATTPSDLLDTAKSMMRRMIVPKSSKSMLVGSMSDLMPDLDPAESPLTEEPLTIETFPASIMSSLTLPDESFNTDDSQSVNSDDLSFFDALPEIFGQGGQTNSTGGSSSGAKNSQGVSLHEVYLLSMLLLLFFLVRNRVCPTPPSPKTRSTSKSSWEDESSDVAKAKSENATALDKSQSQPDVMSVSSSSSLSSLGWTDDLTTNSRLEASPLRTKPNRIVIPKPERAPSMPLLTSSSSPAPSSRSFYQPKQPQKDEPAPSSRSFYKQGPRRETTS